MNDTRQLLDKSAAGADELPKGARTILVVDDDKVARRYLEVSLSRIGNYRLEVASDASGALDVLRTTLIDLILSDISMPDMDGFQFLQRLRRDSRFRNIPVIFISSDSRVATKVGGLQMGIDDYITKPFEVTELKARIDAIFRRVDSARVFAQQRSYNLAGDFTGIPFTELINILELGRRTGKLSVGTSCAMASMYFQNGRPLHAVYGNLEGEEAFYALVAAPNGHFEFSPGEFAQEQPPTITKSCSALLLEAARRIDSNEVQAETAAPVQAAAPAASAASGGELKSAIAPSPPVVSEMQNAISDAFTLGELQFFTAESLREWTASDHAGDRLHVLLLCSLPDGVALLTALASPLPGRQVLTALSEKIRALGLVFHMRGDRMLDIILIDQQAPAALCDALARVPSIVIVAPGNGDWLALTGRACSEIVSLIKRLRPAVVVGMGNDSVQRGLEELKKESGLSLPALCIPGAAGESGTDLREILIQGVRFWGAPAQPGVESKA